MACLSAPFCQTRRASIELLHCVATALSRAPGAGANIERHYRVDLRGLDHDLDVDLLVARTDAPSTRSYFARLFTPSARRWMRREDEKLREVFH